MSASYDYQEVADLLKHIEKLKKHIKYVRASSTGQYKASVYLFDGEGSSVEFYLTPAALVSQLRSKLRDLQERLVEAKEALK